MPDFDSEAPNEQRITRKTNKHDQSDNQKGVDAMYGPSIETQRVIVPGTETYVEIRQERHGNYFGYRIETGSVQFGHRGTWGRSDIREASACFADAITYAATHHHVN